MIVLRECESSTQTNVRKLERERKRKDEKDERRLEEEAEKD